MVGKRANKKVSSKDLEEFVNPKTGETLQSSLGTVTSFNTSDEDYVIMKGEDFVVVERGALKYLESILTQSEMNYVRAFTSMVKGEFNILHSIKDEALTRKTLQEEINIARTTFIKLLSKLHKEGVISYLETYINRGKKVKYVVLNPTLARKANRIRVDTAKLFRDLRKENL